ncbi:MAG: hypothetical protein JO069_01840, partial [Verrucomicrobia bacterium]|nr:hypothetical protein [Verrucomicrobiota bacterium]
MICHDILDCRKEQHRMAREKFATQVDKEILMAIRALAHEEGRRIEQLIDEALSELIEKRRKAR